MSVHRFAECTRTELAELAGRAFVIVPIGATEQHGPHLPVGTDTLIVQAVVDRGVEVAAARSDRPFVLAPAIPFGASDHHLPFGATISLSTETTTAVLVDVFRSLASAGLRRVVLVNGHGGNRGPCHAAAQAAAARLGIRVAYLDYWSLLSRDPLAAVIPGHAGQFESSMVAHLAPHLVRELPVREAAGEITTIDDGIVYEPETWTTLDGYADVPALATADDGRTWFDACAAALADRLLRLDVTW